MATISGKVSEDGSSHANGYSSTRLSKGKYQVRFTQGTFTQTPASVATILSSGSTGKTIGITSQDSDQFTAAIQTNNGNLEDASFDFISDGS